MIGVETGALVAIANIGSLASEDQFYWAIFSGLLAFAVCLVWATKDRANGDRLSKDSFLE